MLRCSEGGPGSRPCSAPSGGAMVLVDQPVEALLAQDGSRAMAGWRLRRVQIEREVWSLAVVMIEVLLKNQLQVALAADEQPVQGLVTQSLDRTLAVGVIKSLQIQPLLT